jgi:uncharacterized membrane protein
VTAATWGLLLATFFASFVEAVEATTIILAMGLTRSWRSTWYGVATALVALAVVTSAFGYALTTWLPESALQLVIGGLLLVFGLQWLRKAILRASGLLARHDELAAFARESRSAEAISLPSEGFDGYSFAVALKGVLLEGVEVIFIVLTFGSSQHRVGLAALAALASVLAVIALGIVARAPLARVPENAMKFAVGVLLTSFGTFWGTEGAGASWPGGEAALPVLVLVIAGGSLAMVGELRGRSAKMSARMV